MPTDPTTTAAKVPPHVQRAQVLRAKIVAAGVSPAHIDKVLAELARYADDMADDPFTPNNAAWDWRNTAEWLRRVRNAD